MRILFIGDVVGRSGRKVVDRELPRLIEQYAIDFVILNGENSAGGFGITEVIFEQFLEAGVDVVTTGNHVWDQREALVFIERAEQLLRPLNFPAGAPGRGAGIFEARNGAQVLVMNAMGRVFMQEMDCPFRAVDAELGETALKDKADAVFLDFHAEATSEKQAMGHFVDGRATCVVGTHTHAPTADDQILPNGTAYQSDAGMTGDYVSVLGMKTKEPITRFVNKIPSGRFEPSQGEATLAGLAVEADPATGLATAVCPVRVGGSLRPIEPTFWADASTAAAQ